MKISWMVAILLLQLPAQPAAAAELQGPGRAPAVARKPPVVVDLPAFAEELYEVSPYTSEEAAIATLVDAEVELAVSRWLARSLVAAGSWRPAYAPPSWDGMMTQLKNVVAPIAKAHLDERERALKSAKLDGKTPFVREYQRLIVKPVDRGQLVFADGAPGPGTPQTEDIPEILAFHRTAAAQKWRKLWPVLRAHAAKIAALHYRVDADPALAEVGPIWDDRAKALVQRIGGRTLSLAEWQQFQSGRLGFTLSGLDRFLLPLGTQMAIGGIPRSVTSIRETVDAVVISRSEGRSLIFRFLDRRWEEDIARRLSPVELEQIENALTASYVKEKGRWFAPLELGWDAYVNISRQLRASDEMQRVYRSFAHDADAAMSRVWARWSGL